MKRKSTKSEERSTNKVAEFSFPNSCLGTPVRETLFRLRSGTLSPTVQPAPRPHRRDPLIARGAKQSFAKSRSQTGVWERGLYLLRSSYFALRTLYFICAFVLQECPP